MAQWTRRSARTAHQGGVLLEHIHAKFSFLKIKKMFLKITIKHTSGITSNHRTRKYARVRDLLAGETLLCYSIIYNIHTAAAIAQRVSFPLRVKKHNTDVVPLDTHINLLSRYTKYIYAHIFLFVYKYIPSAVRLYMAILKKITVSVMFYVPY